jgi:hypothetical protein
VPPFTDDELAQLALAADPDTPIADDAVPFGADAPDGSGSPLPEWYMPPATSTRRTPGRVAAAALVVAALVLVSGAGLCVTSGVPEIAW